MEYKELLRQMIIECKNDADSFLAGNKQDYLYCKERNETYGDTDKNYTNRTRVCYGLMYGEYSSEIIEDAVRELFETEITSRENESFQGVGINIEMLTALLLKYNNTENEKLFERAKNANFDCFLGYNKEYCQKAFEPLDSFSFEDCVIAAGELGKTDYACKFVDIFKEQPLGLKEYRMLKSFAIHDTRRMCDRELAVTGIYEIYMSQPSESIYDLYDAISAYVQLLADKGETDKAADIFIAQSQLFIRFDRGGYEVGSRLIRDGIKRKNEVWEIILPLIKDNFNQIAPITYDPLADTAEIMGEIKLAKKLRKKGEKKMKQ